MVWNITGLIMPTTFLRKHKFNRPMGFALMAVGTRQQVEQGYLTVPIMANDRIADLAFYHGEADRMEAENGQMQGASQLKLGQPALYGFIFSRVTLQSYVATREILTPILEHWLNQGKFEVEDSVVEQAKRFCDGHLPTELTEQYAHVLEDMRKHGNRTLN